MKRGWKPTLLTPTGHPIVDEGTLSKIDTPEAKQLLNYLLVQKRLAQSKSWLEAVNGDGRVHGKVITIGAVTGRMSHSSPNMAQVPAVRSPFGVECRSMWEVDKGNALVGADLSGIELRCFAHYLNDADYTNEIVYGDVHTRNQHLFQVPTRDMAKTVLYAGLYGASPSKLASIIGGSKKDGAKLKAGFEQIPGYKVLLEKVGRASSKGWLPGLDGRRLLVRSQHSALNLLLQGAGAVIFKQWLVVLKDYSDIQWQDPAVLAGTERPRGRPAPEVYPG
jgi:DNA polymerase I-like protein with 3'-5' exonuclease and polymerase domains